MNTAVILAVGRILAMTAILLLVGVVGTIVLLFVFVDVTDFLFGRATLRADFGLLSAVILTTGAILGSVQLTRLRASE